MLQEFHQDQDRHPDILDRAAISRPQAKSWNWRLTVLVFFLFAMSALLLFAAYGDLRSNAVRNVGQAWMTWAATGLGFGSLMSAFLLRRRSQIGWLMATVLISSVGVLYAVFTGKFLLALSQSFISLSELPPELLVEFSQLPLSCFMLYLIHHKAVREILSIPLKWFWAWLAVGGIFGVAVGGWLVFFL